MRQDKAALLVGLVGPGLVAAQRFGGEADGKPKGKPTTKADLVLRVKGNLISF